MSTVKTFPRKIEQYNREFAKIIRANLPNYPQMLCADDWISARYWFNCRRPAEEGAWDVVHKRRMQVATRITARIWRDEFDGTVRIGPGDVPDAVRITMTAAFENGCTNGTVSHWGFIARGFDKTNDVQPELYLWSTL
jgi:hypothetical protein